MIYGICMVRNEADIIAINLQHHLYSEGFDRILVADNGSDDRTSDVIRKLGDKRITLTSRPGQYRQAEALTELARQAVDDGASWIIPFDADEFWHAPGGIAAALRRMTDVGSIEVSIQNFVQRRDQLVRRTSALLKVRYRCPHSAGDSLAAERLVKLDLCPYIESTYPSKYIARARPDILITAGNHAPQKNASIGVSSDIVCLHVPLRARDILTNKVDAAKRLDQAGFPPGHGWHLRRFAAIAQSDRLDQEWIANSEKDGFLDTARGRIALQYDPTLSRLLKPRVRTSALNIVRSVRRTVSLVFSRGMT